MDTDLSNLLIDAGAQARQALVDAENLRLRQLEVMKPLRALAEELTRLPFVDGRGFRIGRIGDNGRFHLEYVQASAFQSKASATFSDRIKRFFGAPAPLPRPPETYKVSHISIQPTSPLRGEPVPHDIRVYIDSGPHKIHSAGEAPAALMRAAVECAPEVMAQMAPARLEAPGTPSLLPAPALSSALQMAVDFSAAVNDVIREAERAGARIDPASLRTPADTLKRLLIDGKSQPSSAWLRIRFNLQVLGAAFKKAADFSEMERALNQGRPSPDAGQRIARYETTYNQVARTLRDLAVKNIDGGLEDAQLSLEVLSETMPPLPVTAKAGVRTETPRPPQALRNW